MAKPTMPLQEQCFINNPNDQFKVQLILNWGKIFVNAWGGAISVE